jgi:hypothetical protein
MNKYRTVLIAFLAGMLAIAASAQTSKTPQSTNTVKRTITKTDRFDFGAGGTLSITGAPNGSITVIGTPKNEIEITAEIAIEAASEADLTRLAAVTTYITDESLSRTGIITVGTHNKLGPKSSAWAPL